MFAKSISICLSLILLVNVVGCGTTSPSQNQDPDTKVEKVKDQQDSQEKGGGKEEKYPCGLPKYLSLGLMLVTGSLAYPICMIIDKKDEKKEERR